MSHREYTRRLTARQLVEYIARDYVEFSYDKIKWQRDDWMKACQDWLTHNPDSEGELQDERNGIQNSDFAF